MIEYKGYTGMMEVDPEAGIIFGRVIGLTDIITFQGGTVAEAVQAFHDSVDDYLEWCAEKGDTPGRPFSGKFILRIDPNLHRKLAIAAEANHKSLNAFVAETLAERFLLEGGSKLDQTMMKLGGENAGLLMSVGQASPPSTTARTKEKTSAKQAGEQMTAMGKPSQSRSKPTGK
jgi:predicted HicB family RNase H-like nuclease